MMHILNILFVVAAIAIVIYAVGDFLNNISINNDAELSMKLNKIKRRMILAICVFAIPIALNLVIGLFSNVSKLFVNSDEGIVEVDNKFLDSSYVWNDDKNYFESKEKTEVIEVVNIKEEVKNNNDNNNVVSKKNDLNNNEMLSNNSDFSDSKLLEEEIVVSSYEKVIDKDNNNDYEEEEIIYEEATIDVEDYVFVDNKKEVVKEEKVISNNNSVTNNKNNNSSNNSYNENKFIDKEVNNINIISNEVDSKLLEEEEKVVVEENKVNHNDNNAVIKNTNELIVNNQPAIKSIDSFTYYNQCDSQWQVRGFCSSGYSMCSNGCGAVAIAMVASTLGNNKNVTPLDVRDYLCSNKLHSNGGMAYAPFTNNGLLNNYGLNGNVFIKYNDNSKYDDTKALAIKAEVDKGNGVILLIPGHYIVLGKNKVCNANQVYMYDPASRSDSGCYTMGELWTKTWNRYNRCYNKKKCGWRMAWSYTSK